MILLDKITIKSVRLLPYFPRYGKLPNFSFKLPHFIFKSNFNIYLSSESNRTMYQNVSYSAIFGIEVLIETIVSDF